MSFNPTNIETFCPSLKDSISDRCLRDGVRKCECQRDLSQLMIRNRMVSQKLPQTIDDEEPQLLCGTGLYRIRYLCVHLRTVILATAQQLNFADPKIRASHVHGEEHPSLLPSGERHHPSGIHRLYYASN